MRFGLIANLKRIGARESVLKCVDWVTRNHHDLLLAEDLRDVVPGHSDFCPQTKIAGEVDVLISMGGDGTLLATARYTGALGTPLLGINLGSLGFLTQQTPEQLVPALEAVVAGKHRIDERMVLKASVSGGEKLPYCYALNDVVLNNGPVSRLLDLTLYVNNERVVTYKSDGLVIATPTGSTAYNLAVGGPIMHPNIQAICVAPISPFALTTRPMIFRPDHKLEIEIASEDREAGLTLDGQIGLTLHDHERVTISRADFTIRFVVLPEVSYYELLRTKLNWGVPPNFNT
jgi:NAD+ kinase